MVFIRVLIWGCWVLWREENRRTRTKTLGAGCSLRSSRFLSFFKRRGDRTRAKSGRAKEHAWGGGEEVSKRGEGVGRKGTACLESQTFYRTPFAHERGAIVQFDWLVARQSNSDIKNLTLVHTRHPEYKIWPSPWELSNFIFRKL